MFENIRDVPNTLPTRNVKVGIGTFLNFIKQYMGMKIALKEMKIVTFSTNIVLTNDSISDMIEKIMFFFEEYEGASSSNISFIITI